MPLGRPKVQATPAVTKDHVWNGCIWLLRLVVAETLVKVLDPGLEAQKFLSVFSLFEALLTSLVTPCGTVELFDQVVATRCSNHLLVVDVNQARHFPY